VTDAGDGTIPHMTNGGMQDEKRASAEDIAHAIRILRDGGVIAIPTDTVYGLAAAIEHPAAIERLFSIKGRSGTKAIPILVSSPFMLDRLADGPDHMVKRLTERFWPGALTVVVTASSDVPDAVVRGGATVGLRMPDHPDALSIIEGVGGALAVTSANRSGELETTSPSEVALKLGRLIDYIVDSGRTPGTTPSTVVDVTRVPPVILREGSIGRKVLSALLDGSEA
jgi:L-threonylcarbamoyladenylate synthase